MEFSGVSSIDGASSSKGARQPKPWTLSPPDARYWGAWLFLVQSMYMNLTVFHFFTVQNVGHLQQNMHGMETKCTCRRYNKTRPHRECGAPVLNKIESSLHGTDTSLEARTTESIYSLAARVAAQNQWGHALVVTRIRAENARDEKGGGRARPKHSRESP